METEPTQAPETTKVFETAQVLETTKIPETTKVLETIKVPETTKAPETTQIPELTKAPETSKTPEVTQTPETDPSPITEAPLTADNELLKQAVKAAAEKYGAVGVQAAVISGGEVAAACEYGWAQINVAAMTADTKIRAASLSKNVIGMVVFRLVDEGILELDADISQYLGFTVRNPYYPDDPITLRMLLSHTSSIGGLGYVQSLSELQALFKYRSAFTDTKPGTKDAYAYNNFAFGLIGTICEAATGKSLTALAKTYFFQPMGIEASWIASELPAGKVAAIYNSSGSVELSVDAQLQNTDATAPGETMRLYAGGLTISAVDYAKLLTLLMNDGCYGGKRLLSSESAAAMKAVQFHKTSYSDQCMPLSRCDGLYGQASLFYHTGSAYGVYALCSFDADTGFGVVVISTGAATAFDTYGLYAICGEISQAVYKNQLAF